MFTFQHWTILFTSNLLENFGYPKEILSIIVDINEIHVFIALYKTWKISFNKNFDRIEFLSILCHRITLYEDIFVIVCHHPRDQAGKV